ncbi:MAG: hypothetical protein JWM66_446 [Solirubrobacterales bacterium]|nr:hypothetical protein [Solirubrobacterales bacterium]
MQGESDANGTNGPRRAAPLFDPVAGMRAMADIQADGLRAASDLLERMLAPDHDDPPAARSRSRSREGDYAALVDAWAQLLRLVAGVAGPGGSGQVTVPIDSSAVAAPVRLVLAGTEHAKRTAAEIWLHNGTSTAVGPLALCCGTLTAPDGDVLDARVGFNPSEVQVLPPRSSRGVVISVAASGRPSPGIYRGTIQADGAPTVWLPFEVVVEPC